MIRPKVLRIIASCIVAITMLFVGYDVFIAQAGPGIGLLFLIIGLSNLVLATLLFVWASILGDQIMMKPKHLRIITSCFVVFAVLLGVGVVLFNTCITGLGSETNLLFLIVVLLNLVQATLLFMWADILERRN